MKTQDFKVHTRSLSSDLPLQLDEEIMERVKILTRRNPLRDPVRLLGVTVSHLVPQESSEQNLFSKSDRNTQRSLAVDALKKRFGETIIKKGALPSPIKKATIFERTQASRSWFFNLSKKVMAKETLYP